MTHYANFKKIGLLACALLIGGLLHTACAVAQTAARPPAPARPPANGASAVLTLRRMVSAYHSLRSLSQTTEAEQVITFDQITHNKQITTLACQRQPARLAKQTSDPIQGKVNYIGSGAKLAVYNMSTHLHPVFATQNTLASLCHAVDTESPQILNPVSFFMEADTPSYLTDAQTLPSATLDGKPCLVIRCRFTPAFLQKLGARLKLSASFKPLQSRATLWIDPQTFFLQKSDVHLAWRGLVTKDGHTGERTPTIDGTERVTQMQINPTLDQAQFQLRRGD